MTANSGGLDPLVDRPPGMDSALTMQGSSVVDRVVDRVVVRHPGLHNNNARCTIHPRVVVATLLGRSSVWYRNGSKRRTR